MVKNKSKNTVLAYKSVRAMTFRQRSIGLIGRSSLPSDECMVFDFCNSIHTLFMKFPIDVLFVKKNGKVCKIYEGLKSFRFVPPVWGAKMTIEFAAGKIRDTNTEVGDIIDVGI